MAGKKKKTSALKVKKKRWISIIAPKIFHNAEVGESYVIDPQVLVGRKLKVNLMSLTNDIKKQSNYIKLRVKDIKDASAVTEVMGYSTIPASVKRLVRRNRDKLDDSFVCENVDNLNVKLKTLILTRNKAKSSATNALVKLNRQILAEYMKKTKFESFVLDVVSTKLQRMIKTKLSKIYPIRIYEIREFSIVEGKLNPRSKVMLGPQNKRLSQAKTETKEQPQIEESASKA